MLLRIFYGLPEKTASPGQSQRPGVGKYTLSEKIKRGAEAPRFICSKMSPLTTGYGPAAPHAGLFSVFVSYRLVYAYVV